MLAFESAKQYYQAQGGGFYRYTQHPLALALAYAKSGNLEQANRELDDHGPGLDPDEDAQLRRLLASTAADN